MVCGIIGLVLFMIPIFWVAALLGIIFGAIGIGKAKRVGRGKGMAIAGLVCGALGIVLGIVIQVVMVGAFTDYMQKSKKSEADLQLRTLERAIKEHAIEKAQLPPSSTTSLPGPDGSACASRDHLRMPHVPMSAWDADPTWRALRFHVDEDGTYTYHWIKTSETSGKALAVGDLDCDTTMTTVELDIEMVDGNVRATYLPPTPD